MDDIGIILCAIDCDVVYAVEYTGIAYLSYHPNFSNSEKNIETVHIPFSFILVFRQICKFIIVRCVIFRFFNQT